MRRLYLLLIYTCACVTVMAQKSENHNFEISRNLEVFNNIYKQLDMYYVDTLSADTTIQWAIRAMLSHVDPFTDYYPEDDTELKQMTTGKYAGIGAVIRYRKKERRCMVVEPFEDSPSMQAGVRAGDIIMTIDGKDTEGMSSTDVTKMLRGEPGTTFELRVKRLGADQPVSMMITRKAIHRPAVPYYGMLNDSVGYVYLSSFTEGASAEMRQALTDLRLKGMCRLLFDLRDNPGGSLAEAVNIVGMFLPKGTKVVYTQGKMKSANREYHTSTDPAYLDLPLTVMVDGGSASAAEIVSGCLQDMDRATIVGARTYGKGLVQSVMEDAYRGSLKITVSRYYIPSGRCIQAYDYRHLNPDGSVGTVPDSLTKVFHTVGGREVRDGGGIKPDVVVKPDSLPTFIYDLVGSDEMMDWVTEFAHTHASIAPAGEFSLTDEDYESFVNYIVKSGFVANRRSDDVLKTLKDVARREGYYEDAREEFDALEAKFKGDLNRDLNRNREQISRYLCDEIVSRYYFQRGVVRQQIVGDKCVEEALKQ